MAGHRFDRVGVSTAMQSSVLRLFLITLAAIPVLSALGCRGKSSGSSTQVASKPTLRTTVSAVGKIEPGEGTISIAGPMGERIEKVLVRPGRSVKAGEQLVELVAERVLSAQVDLARAKLEQAQQMLRAEEAHARAILAESEQAVKRANELPDIQVSAAAAEVKVYEVQLQQAERDYDRVVQVTPSGDLDRLKQPVDRLREQLRAARARLRLMEKERDLNRVEAQRKQETIKTGLEKSSKAIDVETAKRNVALAEAELARVTILAPIDARVLQVFAQAGETVGQRPLLTLGDTSAMYVRAEVYEADISRVKIGQSATVTSIALDKELTGTVDRIGQVVQKNEVFGLDPTAKTDARVIEVRIRLKEPEPATGRIGLQVDVTINTATEEPAPANP